jgi:hypothetical protein
MLAKEEVGFPLGATELHDVHVMSADQRPGLLDEDMPPLGARVAAISTMGFARTSATALLPMCSTSQGIPDRASVSRAHSSRNALDH